MLGILSLTLTGLSVAALPMILLYILIFVVFLALLYWILGLLTPTSPYAKTITLIVGGIILLIFLISLVNSGTLFNG